MSKKARKKLPPLIVKDIREALSKDAEKEKDNKEPDRVRLDTSNAEDHVYRIIRGLPSVVITNIHQWKG